MNSSSESLVTKCVKAPLRSMDAAEESLSSKM